MSRFAFLLAIALLVASIDRGDATTGNAEARCVRLESRIADLQLKLRMGYGAQEGRVYRQKLAALRSERRHLCRR